MSRHRTGWAFTFAPALFALACAAATAGPTETAKKAADAASGGVTKAERAVKKGARAANDGIERGVKAANRGVDKAATKMGLPGVGTPPTTPDSSQVGAVPATPEAKKASPGPSGTR